MSVFAHIIAEWNHGRWSAWFSHNPCNICGGDDWASAVAVLIDTHGSPRLRWDQIVAIDEATRVGHAEFIIPYAHRLGQWTAVSMN